MKKILLIIIIFLPFNIYAEDELDVAGIYENLYGIKQFTDEDEINLDKINNSFLPILLNIKNDKNSINDIEIFFKEVNNDTLSGISLRDSILQYIGIKNNDELINLLNNYLKNNDSQAIKDIIEIRKNLQNYTGSNFCFSTILSRKNIHKNISMITPNSEWKEMNYGDNKDSKTQIAGDDNYTGTIYFKYYIINKLKFDISKDVFEAKHAPMLLKRIPEGELKNLKESDMFRVKPGKVKMISENITMGNMTFDKIYEQITTNSEKYDFQKLVIRTRYYIKGKDLYLITIQSIIGGEHVLADKINLIIQHGLLLDTVKFE